MKDKIIARIKAKFPDVNLSAKRLDAIADKLTSKVTDENEIDAKLDEFNDYNPLSEIAKADDKIRDLNSKVKTVTKPTDTSSQSSSTTKDDGKTDDAPEWAKSLVESNKQLAEKLAAMEKEKFQQAIQQKVSAHEKLKGIPSVFYKGRSLPEKEEDLETFVDGIKTDYDTFKQETNNEGLINGHKPGGGFGSVGDEKVSSAAKKFIASANAGKQIKQEQ